MSGLDSLAELPPGVAEAGELIAGLDGCLECGLARLGPPHREALARLSATLAGSPLERLLGDSVAALERSEFQTRHFAALAAARAALQGAQHDALYQQLCGAMGGALRQPDAGQQERVESEISESPLPVVAGPAATLLHSIQQWLMELALAGFQHLDESAVAPFAATLERLQAEPTLASLAVLLTGFVNELLASVPTRQQPELPIFRWADLWTAAMVRSQQLPGPATYQEVDGELTPFGLVINSHANFVSATLYGLLRTSDAARTIRLGLGSYKVDVVEGPEVWALFGSTGEALLKSLADCRRLHVEQAELSSLGDLRCRVPPKLGKPVDPFAAAADAPPLPPPPALLRHPVHLAQVVRLDSAPGLPLASERISSQAAIDERACREAAETLCLVRFDQGGWRLQPLCVRTTKGIQLAGGSLAEACKKAKSKTLAILQERSGKLLRAS